MPDLVLDWLEIRRNSLLARELAWIAEKESWNPEELPPFLTEVREELFDGRALTSARASQLRQSLGIHVFELEFFREHGIPLAGHSSQMTTAPDDESDDPFGLNAESEFEFRWDDGSLKAKVGDRLLRGHMTDEDGPWPSALNGSVFSKLARYADFFCHRFPWTRDGAIWFILTGEAPMVLPITLNRVQNSQTPESKLVRVHLTIHPWTSLKSVVRAYKRIQKFYFKGRIRPPEPKSLDFFDFVSRCRHEGSSWSETMRAWTTAHRSERRRYPLRDKSSVRQFAGKYEDIAQQILRPYEGGGFERIRPSVEKAK